MTCKKFLNYNYILNLLAYNLSYVSQMVIEKFYLRLLIVFELEIMKLMLQQYLQIVHNQYVVVYVVAIHHIQNKCT